MDIINFENKHIPKVLEISKSVFKDDSWDREQFRKEIDRDTNYSYVILKENSVIAFMIASFDYENLELLIIAIDSKFRKQGMAKKLMDYLFLLAKKISATKIVLEVGEKNIAAINLYKKYNFIEIARKENYYYDGSSIIIMSCLNYG